LSYWSGTLNVPIKLFESIIKQKFFYIFLFAIALYLFWKKKKYLLSTIDLVKSFICFSLLGSYVFVALDIVGSLSLQEFKFYYLIKKKTFDFSFQVFPFCDGLGINDFLNILFFVPLGFLLPLFWQKYRKAFATVLLGFCFSSFLEFSQLFNPHRQFEFNDIITNTIGSACGWGCFYLVNKLLKKNKSLLDTKGKMVIEPIIIMIIAIVAEFFFFDSFLLG